MTLSENSLRVHPPDTLHEVLEYAKDVRGIDFNAYRASTIERRLALRLRKLGMQDLASYYRFLKKDPEEIDALVDALTVTVSHFFRDPFVFEALGNFVFPELINTHKKDPLRIWCAGCARGEEAYSAAILLKEILSRETDSLDILIVATDIDRDALDYAEKAVYRADSLFEAKKGHLDRYFTKEADLFRLKDEIRSMVTFAYHDITTKPPKKGVFSDYHLVLCRNVLIYFNRAAQEHIISNLAGLLQNRGYLVLGEAETLPQQFSGGFGEIIPRTKIFRKGRCGE